MEKFWLWMGMWRGELGGGEEECWRWGEGDLNINNTVEQT